VFLLGIISVADALELDIGGVPTMAMSKMVGRWLNAILVSETYAKKGKSIEPGDDYCVDWGRPMTIATGVIT
jgi:hypothetical protein